MYSNSPHLVAAQNLNVRLHDGRAIAPRKTYSLVLDTNKHPFFAARNTKTFSSFFLFVFIACSTLLSFFSCFYKLKLRLIASTDTRVVPSLLPVRNALHIYAATTILLGSKQCLCENLKNFQHTPKSPSTFNCVFKALCEYYDGTTLCCLVARRNLNVALKRAVHDGNNQAVCMNTNKKVK